MAKKRTTGGQQPQPIAAAAADTTWDPSQYAVWSQRWSNPRDESPAATTTVMLRHPSVPYIGTFDGFTAADVDALKTMGIVGVSKVKLDQVKKKLQEIAY